MAKERLKKADLDIPEPSEEILTNIEELLPEIQTIAMEDVESDDLYSLYQSDLLPHIRKFSTREEDEKLAKRVRCGGQDGLEARNELFYSVALLVVAGAKRRSHGNRQLFLDLIQEGNIAVWQRAVDKYDPERGYKFTTYAWWWIQQSQLRAALKDSRIDKVTDHVEGQIKRLNRMSALFLQKHGREPNPEEAAIIADLTIQEAKELTGISKRVEYSLSDKIDQSSGTDVEEIIMDKKAPYREGLENLIDEKDEFNAIISEIARLPKRHKQVLLLRLGINEDGTWKDENINLEEVAEQMGLTRERVRQLQLRAIYKIDDWKIKKTLHEILTRTPPPNTPESLDES